jgi:RNA polymerase sigma factor (TIGR02999 family)
MSRLAVMSPAHDYRETTSSWQNAGHSTPVADASAHDAVNSGLLRHGGVHHEMNDRTGAVSRLLRAWAGGDVQARDELVPLVYHELRHRAAAYLRRERRDHTLQATALVHEAFLRLVGQDRVAWQNRGHFYALASQMMRRILVDHARERQAAKRPDASLRVDLDDRIDVAEAPAFDLVVLDEALSDLSKLDPRQGRIVELRFFGGLSEQEVAEALSLSRTTVTREWRRARAWLYHRMTPRPVRAPS